MDQFRLKKWIIISNINRIGKSNRKEEENNKREKDEEICIHNFLDTIYFYQKWEEMYS